MCLWLLHRSNRLCKYACHAQYSTSSSEPVKSGACLGRHELEKRKTDYAHNVINVTYSMPFPSHGSQGWRLGSIYAAVILYSTDGPAGRQTGMNHSRCEKKRRSESYSKARARHDYVRANAHWDSVSFRFKTHAYVQTSLSPSSSMWAAMETWNLVDHYTIVLFFFSDFGVEFQHFYISFT